MQAKGTVKKNRISSKGNPINFMPMIYLSLNDHTPWMVNSTSQNKKSKPVIAMPGQINFQLLAKATRLSNDNKTGKIMVSTLIIR